MKQTIFAAIMLAGVLLVSCAKEKDAYDKNLTADTWNYTGGKTEGETVTEKIFTDGTPNNTKTERKTSTVENGKLVEEDYTLQQTVGQNDYFLKYTTTWDFSATYKFEQDGSLTHNESNALRSILTEETAEQPITVTYTNAPTTLTANETWAWQNNGQQKAVLAFNLGDLDVVSLKKNEMVLKFTQKRVETAHPSSALTVITTTSLDTEITFTR